MRDVISRNFSDAAVKEREDLARQNSELEEQLKKAGLTFNYPEKAPFRKTLEANGFYAEWKKRYGDATWAVLEKYSGTLS